MKYIQVMLAKERYKYPQERKKIIDELSLI